MASNSPSSNGTEPSIASSSRHSIALAAMGSAMGDSPPVVAVSIGSSPRAVSDPDPREDGPARTDLVYDRIAQVMSRATSGMNAASASTATIASVKRTARRAESNSTLPLSIAASTAVLE